MPGLDRGVGPAPSHHVEILGAFKKYDLVVVPETQPSVDRQPSLVNRSGERLNGLAGWVSQKGTWRGHFEAWLPFYSYSQPSAAASWSTKSRPRSEVSKFPMAVP